MDGGLMRAVVFLTVVFAGVIGSCLLALRRRGGTGARGAWERGAAGHEFARVIGAQSTPGQTIGGSGL